MQNKKTFLTPLVTGILLLMITGFWLGTAQPVAAQCGSQASTCKDCHETQAQDPVNTDGTNWHQAHAFGDFCYMCHAGNSQAADKTASHTGLVAPMSDIKGSCSSCHVKDFGEKAQVYATTLGISLAEAAPTTAPTNTPATPPTQVGTAGSSGASEPEAPKTKELNLPTSLDPMSVVDYSLQYDQVLVARQKTNWSNVLLAVFVGLLVVTGGYYGLSRLGWVKVSFVDTKQVQDEYPADLVDMLPDLAQLKPDARKALQRTLKKPAAAEFLMSLDHLFSDVTEK